MDRIALGKYTESLACKHLQNKGLLLRESNYRCKLGEIDLIMQDGQTLVFVEVRYRESAGFGNAAESIDRFKQQKLLRCAQHYLSVNHQHRSSCRFDVVSLNGPLNELMVDWIPAAFMEPS